MSSIIPVDVNYPQHLGSVWSDLFDIDIRMAFNLYLSSMISKMIEGIKHVLQANTWCIDAGFTRFICAWTLFKPWVKHGQRRWLPKRGMTFFNIRAAFNWKEKVSSLKLYLCALSTDPVWTTQHFQRFLLLFLQFSMALTRSSEKEINGECLLVSSTTK